MHYRWLLQPLGVVFGTINHGIPVPHFQQEELMLAGKKTLEAPAGP